MSQSWPLAPLSRAIRQRADFVRIDDLQEYKRCRVQLHAKGIVLRDTVSGSEIKTKEQQICRAGQFLVAEIDAKVGGYGIVPEDLDGAVVSSHYFLFEIDGSVLDRRYLDFFIRTPAFADQVRAQGSTNYAAIRPAHVLGYSIPLPPLDEQRRIVARIEALAAKIEEARGLRQQSVEEGEALIGAAARRLLASVRSPLSKLGDWTDPKCDGIQTRPFGAQLGWGDFATSGVPVLTIGNIQFGGLTLADLKYVTLEKAEQLARYQVKPGDILFARMGTVGRCCLAPPQADGWLINYHIIRVRLDKSRVEPRYVHWSIRASSDIEAYLDETIRGATRQGVNSGIVAGLPCRVPCVAEQRPMVAHLDSLQAKVDALKRLQAETAAALDALLPPILDRAFKGEL